MASDTTPTPSPSALLPCPFCGGPAQHFQGLGHHAVSCLGEDCPGGAPTACGPSEDNTPDAAARRWNTRATEPETQDPLPCPCGNADSLQMHLTMLTPETFRVACKACLRSGPRSETNDAAVAAWNQCAARAPVSGAEREAGRVEAAIACAAYVLHEASVNHEGDGEDALRHAGHWLRQGHWRRFLPGGER